MEAAKRVGGRRQTYTSVLKWPSEAIALLSAPLAFRECVWKTREARKAEEKLHLEMHFIYIFITKLQSSD